MARRALVLGSQTGGLTGVESDTGRMTELLGSRKLEFTVDLRTGAQATRAGILDGYHKLIHDSHDGDVAVIYYSGHGHHAINRDPSGSLRVFQGIVPTDYAESTECDYRGISSWELSVQLAALTRRTTNVTVILDCCHASQMSRDGAARDAVPRALPHPMYVGFEALLDALRSRYPGEIASLTPFGNPHAVRLVACSRSGSAYEYTSCKGVRTGAFTEALVDVLGEVDDVPISWAAVGQAVRERVLRTFATQRPDIEGPLRRQVFSLTEDDRIAIAVAPSAGGLRLRAGSVHGVSRGDVYGVMPLGATAFDRARAIALVTVDAVSATSAGASVLEWLNAHTGIPRDSVAVPHQIAATRRAVEIVAPAAQRGALEQAIAAVRTLRVAMPGDVDRPLASLRLADDRLIIEDARGPLFPAAAYPAGLEPAVQNLRNLGVAQALRELEGEHGVSEPREIAIELGVVDDGRVRTLPDRGASLGLGDRICVRLASRAQRRLYAHVFNIGLRGTITLLSGAAPYGIALDKGDEHVLGADDATGALTGWRLFWPEGMPLDLPRIDEIVVIVTTAPASLASLETRELVSQVGGRARGSQLQQLVAQLQDGLTRDAGTSTSRDTFLVKRLSYFLHPRAGRIGDLAFEIDENPQLRSSARVASAWVEPGDARPPGLPSSPVAPPDAVAIRIGELVVENNRAWFAADIRIDALVCTRSGAEDGAYRVATLSFEDIQDGERLPLDNALLFHGPVRDFVDICLWVSRDTAGSLRLADLFACKANSPELRDAAQTLLVAPGAAASPWVAAVGASAVLARMAYELILEAAGSTIGLYRTSFLAHEQFGVGRHPAERLYRAQDFSFSLRIEPV